MSDTLFVMPTASAEQQMLRARPPLNPKSKRQLIVLVALGRESNEEIGQEVFEQCFAKTTLGILSEKGALACCEVFSAICAWFRAEDGIAAMHAVEQIQLAARACKPARRPAVMTAVSRTEFGACQLVHLAGDDQALIDDDVWSAVPDDLQARLLDLNVHPPDERDAAETIHSLAQSAVQRIIGGKSTTPSPSSQAVSRRRGTRANKVQSTKVR